MKILAVAHCYLPLNRGGAELMMHRILSELASQGHEVTVAVTETGPRNTETEVDRVRVRYTSAGKAFKEKPDRVVTHLKETSRVLSWCEKNDARSAVLVHSDHRWILMDLSHRPDTIIFNTNWVRDSVNSRVDLSDRCVVMHPPVNPGEFETTPGDFVTLVNPLPEKGAGIFYEAAERLPSVDFLVVEGGYERNRQVFKDLPNVTVQKHTSNMKQDVYSRTGVLVMPSSFESYGMTAVEAAASGIPVVAAPTPGLKESLGPYGIFHDIDDVESWIATVGKLTSDRDAWLKASRRIQKARGRVDSDKEIKDAASAILGSR